MEDRCLMSPGESWGLYVMAVLSHTVQNGAPEWPRQTDQEAGDGSHEDVLV